MLNEALSDPDVSAFRGPFSLTWINFNPSMDK